MICLTPYKGLRGRFGLERETNINLNFEILKLNHLIKKNILIYYINLFKIIL